MSDPVADLATLLRTMRPVRHPGVYVYCAAPPGLDLAALPAVAWVREAEGATVILEAGAAIAAGLAPAFRAAWITLTVHSDLAAVGLTAAVARALADAGIACNVVAGLRHDHLFVPVDRAESALAVLATLQTKPGGSA